MGTPEASRKGLGSQLLRFVLRLAAKMAEEVGCAGVVVDAKPGAIELYEKYGFVPFDRASVGKRVRRRPARAIEGREPMTTSAVSTSALLATEAAERQSPDHRRTNSSG